MTCRCVFPQKLVTAAGVALCRHGILLRLLNLFTGERHAYSTAAVQSLLVAGTAVQYWWYDIACRWSQSYHKWLEQQDSVTQDAGRGMRCLVQPWHAFAHRYGVANETAIWISMMFVIRKDVVYLWIAAINAGKNSGITMSMVLGVALGSQLKSSTALLEDTASAQGTWPLSTGNLISSVSAGFIVDRWYWGCPITYGA